MENNLSRSHLENLSPYQESQVISIFLFIMVMRSHPSISFKSAILEDGYFYGGLQLLSGQYIMRFPNFVWDLLPFIQQRYEVAFVETSISDKINLSLEFLELLNTPIS
jgi:hypothetical protein